MPGVVLDAVSQIDDMDCGVLPDCLRIAAQMEATS